MDNQARHLVGWIVCVLAAAVVGFNSGRMSVRSSKSVEVTALGSVGSNRTMYSKLTGQEIAISRQNVVFAGSETLYVSKDVFDDMQVGDTITPVTLSSMRRESARIESAYHDLLETCQDEKPSRPPKTH